MVHVKKFFRRRLTRTHLCGRVKGGIPPGRNQKNFFETRVTEYQTGGALSWD